MPKFIISVLTIIFLYSMFFFRLEIKNNIYLLRKNLLFDTQITQEEKDYLNENIDLKAKLSRLNYLEKENELLKEALNFKKKENLELIEANIVGYDNFSKDKLVILNSGSENGVSLNQSIVYRDYFVGKIVEVDKNISKAIFLNSNNFNVAVKINNELNSEGVLKNNYGLELFVDLVPKTEKVAIGDFVYTSGLGDIREGILIGQINKIDETDLFYKIYLEYPFNLNKLNKVFIIK